LSLIVYFETNWIVGAVLGQDPRAEELLASSKQEIELAIPSACLMEAISAFDWKKQERNQLASELDRQLTQVRRSGHLLVARELTKQLFQAKMTNDKLLSEFFQRLDDFLDQVAHRAELIPLSSEAVEFMVQERHESEPKLGRKDSLILDCVLRHSREHQSAKRAFLTGNIHDFDVGRVRSLLAQNGVKFFSSTERVLEWASAARRSSS